MAPTGKRSFWLHQLAEYVVGFALVASGLRSSNPLVPAVCGGAIVLNAAFADGPFGAFRRIGRRVHRVVDATIVLGGLAASVLVELDTATRIVALLALGVFGVVVARSDFEPVVARRRTSASLGSDRAERIGRRAGRAAGMAASTVSRWRRR